MSNGGRLSSRGIEVKRTYFLGTDFFNGVWLNGEIQGPPINVGGWSGWQTNDATMRGPLTAPAGGQWVIGYMQPDAVVDTNVSYGKVFAPIAGGTVLLQNVGGTGLAYRLS